MSEWFREVVGQESAKLALRRALEGDRLTGSLLICGPRGTGRALLARELARAMGCRSASGPKPCGDCGSCRKIASGASGDCVFLRPTDKPSIGIDQVREMLDELALAPVEGGKRVFIIDPASALKEEAQNALLKGLEEPPPRSILVLIAEHEGELLSTIASRCLVIRADELTTQQTVHVLERLGVPADEVRRRALWSGGSPGEALEDDALDVADLGSATLEAFASGAALSDPMPTIEELLSFAQGKSGDTTDSRRRRISRVLRALQRAVRDALLAREGSPLPRCSGVDEPLLSRLAMLPHGRLERAAQSLLQVEEELARNANTKLVLDGLVLDVGAALAPAC